MKPTFSAFAVLRAALVLLLSIAVASCGGGGSVPYSGVTVRPLAQDFTARRAVAYSPYRTSASAADLAAEAIPKDNILQDLNLLLAGGFRLIRLFDSSDKVARQTLEVIRDNHLNLRVQLGAYLTPGDEAASQAELARCVALANDFQDLVLAVSIGNENMVSWSFNKIDPTVMARYIRTVRSQITQPVTSDDNYAFWASAPTVVTNEIDFVSLHTYAELDTVYDPTLWDWKQKAVAADQRAAAMMDGAIAEARRQYQVARSYLDSVGLSYIPITIGETGWNAVDDLGQLQFRAHPVNQKMYLDRLATWAAEGRTGPGPKQVFYFEAFDEPWKQSDDGWGLFNKNRQARYAVQALNADGSVFGNATWTWEPGSYTDTDALYFVPPTVNASIDASRYVLYSDLAPAAGEVAASGLRWDAFDGTTAGYAEVAGNYGPGDASHSLQITPKPAGYGWGLLLHSPSNATDNLGGFSGGTLNFMVSTTYPGKIEIGIATDTQDRVAQEAYLQIAPGQYGYCNTGAWCTVSIPLKAFLTVNPKLDLTLVLSRFVIADRYAFTGNAAGSTNPIAIDGIAWAK